MSATYVTTAWSCTARMVIEDRRALRAASADLDTMLASADRRASRFRPDSDLARANALAGRPVPVPRMLAELVSVAIDAAVQTDGLLDPTVGARLAGLGYDRDIAAVRAGGYRTEPRVVSAASWRDIRLDREAGLLTVPAGTALDLGATAKAHLADQTAHALAERYDTAVMVELGGDLAVAGRREGGWCIDVAERAGGGGERLTIRHGGIATSTTTLRRWTRAGEPMHHIVDPRTGLPADGPWRTATVYAPSALAANVASTAAIILGDDATRWLTVRGLIARLVAVDGSITTTDGWPTGATGPTSAATAVA